MGMNFKPQIWTATILRTLEDNLIGTKICTEKFTGELKKAGDTVYFPGLADPTISSYTGTVTYEELQDAGVQLKVEQQDYFAFKVDDIETAQVNIDAKGSQASRAAYKLKQSADTYIMKFYPQAGILGTDATITTANILSKFGELTQKLMEANVYDKNIWCVIPPWVKIKLELAGIKFSINNGINGTGGMAWTDQLGYDLFVTNQVVNSGTAAVPISQIMAGSYNSIAFANQINETENLRLESTFADAVRGLHVYDAKIIKPKEVATVAWTFGAESAI